MDPLLTPNPPTKYSTKRKANFTTIVEADSLSVGPTYHLTEFSTFTPTDPEAQWTAI